MSGRNIVQAYRTRIPFSTSGKSSAATAKRLANLDKKIREPEKALNHGGRGEHGS
jgi:hypothetical protein